MSYHVEVELTPTGYIGGIPLAYNEILKWINENCTGKVWHFEENNVTYLNKFIFENENEALHFRLVWG